MQNIFNKLLNKPKAVRYKIVWILTILVGFIIFIAWLLFLPRSISHEIKEEDEFKKAKGELKESLSGYFDQFKEKMREIEKVKKLDKKKLDKNKSWQESRLPLED